MNSSEWKLESAPLKASTDRYPRNELPRSKLRGTRVILATPLTTENEKTRRLHMRDRIILADDHKIIREGLRSLLERQPDMEVVAETQDGLTTVSLVQKLQPDVVIIDTGMPEMNGIDATTKITTENKIVKVIALSMHSNLRFVMQMLKAGAVGYLLKDSVFEELVSAIPS